MVIEAMPSIVGGGGLPADPGRPISDPDVAIGRSVPLLIETPALGEEIGEAILAFLAVSNDAGWKPVTVETFIGSEPLTVVAATRKAVMGFAESVLGAGSAMLIDVRSELVVRLVDPAQLLGNLGDAALVMGGNLAMVGDELIQFGRADMIEPGRYRLSRLVRGRRGTEWAIGGHASGETFCLIAAASLRSLEIRRDAAGATLAAVAHGVADAAPLPRAEKLLSGEAMRPLAPCHLTIARSTAGLDVAWTRRSHRGWSWIDGGDVPADGFAERYRLTIDGPGGQYVIECVERSTSIANAALPASAGQQIIIAVRSLGPFAPSRPARATLII